MAELNYDYDTQNGQYSDGDIEERMLEMARQGITYEELPKEQVEFPMVYHFAGIRENILNWYPFTKQDSVLEIGAGCGALTGMLCEKAGKVTAVELSGRRAAINYERHKDYDNLTIMVGNLNDMVLEKDFDYIVLNGVLEYAASFTDGETPYESFLNKMASFLKHDGKLLVAIENRLGLKYFAGAPEDHADMYFLGLNRYAGNNSVRTFSKSELTRLFEKSGLCHMKYYYPYPDYKFPTEIFTDETLKVIGYGKQYPVFTENRFSLFNETDVAHSLLREEVMDNFVNSFLVEASREDVIRDTEILYAKINSERKEEFRVMTLILKREQEIFVKKQAMNARAKEFLHQMERYGQAELPGSFKNLKSVYKDGAVSYEFLTGKTYYNVIKDYLKEGDSKSIEKLFQNLYETYFTDSLMVEDYHTEEFVAMFGETKGRVPLRCISPANIDLICQNIFLEGEEKTIIDYEWIADFPVPVDFIMWRLLNEIYTKMPSLDAVCPRHKIIKKLGITLSDQEVYLQWALHFAYTYVGCDQLSKYEKPPVPISLEQIAEQEKLKKYLDSKIYYDLGSGLNENQVVAAKVRLERNCFKAVYDLRGISGIKGLRWDPENGYFCKCRIDKVDCNCRAVLVPNGLHLQDKDSTVFITEDPNYIISTLEPDKVEYLVIEGKFWYMDDQYKTELLREMACEKLQPSQPAPVQTETNVEPPAVTMKSRAKKVLRPVVRKLRREGDPDKPRILICPGSVDQISYENKLLTVIGWVFDPAHEMGKPRIAFYHGKNKVSETGYQVIYRKDVAENMGNQEAESSGFSVTASVYSPFDLDVYFEFDTIDGTGGRLLGTIPGDRTLPADADIQVFSAEDETSIGDIRYFKKCYVDKPLQFPEDYLTHEIDIVVPVYNGLSYFDALFAGVEKTRMKYRLIIIDDCSPDEKVKEYLETYAKDRPEVILLRNEQNLGFLKTVNRGLKLIQNHAVLLNTDVEVPENWLERLMYPIICGTKVATTTPFTTCGTLCSFPEFCKDNAIFEGMKLWQIDDVFRSMKPQYPSMPTGIGFCMGLNREALSEVGYLDEENFGKGYGEENDWCQRALQAGYRNVHVDNLYVYHKHGGSFLSEEKMMLLEKHSKKLLEKHPDYNKDVAEYCRIDPARMVRLYAIMQLLNQKTEVKTIVAFDHNLGGGATEYLNKKVKEELLKGRRFIVIRYDIYTNKYLFLYQYKDYRIKFFSENLQLLLDMVRRVDEIWINELVTYPKLYDFMERIVGWKEEHCAVLRMLLHDFFCICPAVNLMDKNGAYCKAASDEICNQCIPDNRSNACLEYESGSVWRCKWKEFLRHCDEIFAFSDDSADLLNRAYPEIYKIRVIPHEPHYLPPISKKYKTTPTLNIGLLGVLCYKKGLDVVKEMVREIERKNLNIRIHLIGVSDEEIDSPVFSYTGRYTREMLPKLTLEEDIDIFFIPSIWPETFSYTTSEIMSMKMPIAVFNIGAPVERVARYDRGIVLDKTDAPSVLAEISKFAEEVCHIDEMPVREEKILFLGEEISFASRYRVEHLREQLLCQGYASRFIQMDEAKECRLKDYKAVVFYRCSNEEGVRKIVRKAEELGIPAYYDIDDLIFDYDRIASLHFLEGEEYKDFRSTTRKIHACMEQCSGYITSTVTLARQISAEFPHKPVVINRNTASMEMQILSHDAIKTKVPEKEKIYIGYFSGSKTHDRDFAVIEDALIEMMEKYPQVMLKLVGVLSEDKMKRFQDRIEKMGFMEWQKLPEALAGVDINLMPLENTVFHSCKSENKWMEAALVKVPSVMSRNDELEPLIQNGVEGYLCSTKEEWAEALEALITDSELRHKIGKAANKKVLDQYVTQKTGQEAVKFLMK